MTGGQIKETTKNSDAKNIGIRLILLQYIVVSCNRGGPDVKEVTVPYTTIDGKKREVTYPCDVREIYLENKYISSIDFDGIELCTQLETLNLGMNKLKELDLAPLASCSELRSLNLYGNDLEVVDLSPLVSCSKLRKLYLHENILEMVELVSCSELRELNLRDNNLEVVDFSSLASCSELRRLDLGKNKLQEVDLSPIASCSNLRELNLWNNNLEVVDLSSLASCSELRELNLRSNNLEVVDLFPLASCSGLQELDISKNDLEDLDLAPLASCSKLQKLYLWDNELREVDLSPLTSWSELQTLNLRWNKLQEVDLSPLASCSGLQKIRLGNNSGKDIGVTLLSRNTVEQELEPSDELLKELNYDTPLLISRLGLIRYLARIVHKHESNSWKVTHLATSLAQMVGLEEIGLLDINSSTLLQILDASDTDMMRQELVECYYRQLDAGGTTIGTDANALTRGSSEKLVERIPDILKFREKEMKAAATNIWRWWHSDCLDLRPLWLTAYGYEILSALELGLECTMEEVAPISEAFAEIGAELRTTDTGERMYPPTKMSKQMREYIFKLAEHRSKNSK
jgi:Leucine-rich repeat (LRR) protein